MTPVPANSASSVTGFVIPRIVRSPSSSNVVSPVGRTVVLRNVIVGCSSDRRKSPLFRWLSRISWFVFTLEATISTFADESSRPSPTTTSPLNSVNRPRALESRCRTTNSTDRVGRVDRVRPCGRELDSLDLLTACDICSSSLLLVITPVTTATQALTRE